jgi:hypothetical protein
MLGIDTLLLRPYALMRRVMVITPGTAISTLLPYPAYETTSSPIPLL